MSTFALKSLSALRMAAGLSTVLLPRQVAPLFGLTLASDANIVARLFGSRDFVLGAFLWRTVSEWDGVRRSSAAAAGGDAAEVRRALLAAAAGNAGDGGAKSVGGRGVAGLAPGQAEGLLAVETVRRQSVVTALWLGLMCDVIDVVSVGVCALEGSLSELAIVELAGAGAIMTAAAIWQLAIIKREDAEKD